MCSRTRSVFLGMDIKFLKKIFNATLSKIRHLHVRHGGIYISGGFRGWLEGL